MSALPYLFLTTLKNRIRSFFQKPANWIATLVMAALLGLVVFSGGLEVRSLYRPMSELYAIVSLLYIAMFVLVAYNGVHKGATLYTLADIHLLFPAPLRPQKILLYGMIKQMGTSLMVGFFLLFQYSWVRQQYGVSMTFLIVVLVGYGLTLFLGQLAAMTLYSLTHASEKKRKVIKQVILGLCGAGAAYVLLPVLRDTTMWTQTGAKQLSRLPMLLFPVGGWMRGLVEGIFEGRITQVLWALFAAAAFAYAGFMLLGRQKTDFYEDVIKTTETQYQTLTARKQGNLQEVLPENIKVGKTGIGGGSGASVLFYKHRLESRRAKRFILDTMSLVMLASSLLFAFIMRGQGFAVGFSFATYMQLFSISSGRWVKELTRPYVYMMPDSSYRKLIYCLGESMLGYVVEAVLLMVPMGLIFTLSPVEIVAAVIARISFSLLFVAGNLLLEKLFAGMKIKVLLIMLYFLTMIVLSLPGIVLAAVLASSSIILVSETITILAVLTLVNLLISPGILYLCRNVLNNPEWGSA